MSHLHANFSIDVLINKSTAAATDAELGEGPIFKAIKLFLYSFLFAVSVVGNTLVLVTIVKRHRMRTVTNYFILNLAAADLALTCICIPFDIPVQENDYKWPYGNLLCKLLYPMQTTVMFASIFTLTTLSLSRFWAIVYPLKAQMSHGQAFVSIMVIWILSAILTAPYVVVLRLEARTMRCVESWSREEHRKAYTLSLFMAQYLLPLLIITLAYTRIAIDLRGRRGVGSNLSLQAAQRKETRKVLRLLVVVTGLFAVCVLPNNVMWLWLDFGDGQRYKHFRKLVTVTNIMLFANCAANPVAYTICHENFRGELKAYRSSFSKLHFCSPVSILVTCSSFFLRKVKSSPVGNNETEMPRRRSRNCKGVEDVEETGMQDLLVTQSRPAE